MPDQPLPQLLKTLDRDRLAAYDRNLRFYNGDQWPPARTATARRRLTLNYARAAIDKITSNLIADRRLQISPRAAGGAPADAELAAARAAELALADLSDLNSLPRLDYETEVDASVLGDGAYKVTWATNAARVLITAPDPQGLFAWRDPYDPALLTRLAHRYTIPAPEAARFGVSTTRDASAIEDWTATSLDLWVNDTRVSSEPNAYGFIPYAIFPNLPVPKSPWGLSDITVIREVAEEMNRTFTALSRILEVSGNPIAVLEGVEQSTDIAVEPGAIWDLPERSKAYLLDLLAQGGVKIHLDYINDLYRALHDLAELPRTAFGDNQRSLSGVALEIELRPLQQKVARKRVIRAQAYRRRAEMALALLDQYTGTTHSQAGAITFSWGDVTPGDPTEAVARERSRVEAQLSTHKAAMARLGEDDPDAEWAALLAEAADQPPPPPPTTP